jgi:hypothetical protein
MEAAEDITAAEALAAGRVEVCAEVLAVFAAGVLLPAWVAITVAEVRDTRTLASPRTLDPEDLRRARPRLETTAMP